ncbi:hypothetical protein [Flavobacterium poyangense]|uniref:hypothetical protein n=1 Tax=Flavobacterium poyangense TaxID=2204302 RepID=UPI00141DDD43|nr:hypothetical protein [Flavobacterium sp. JXAS1]
MIISTYPFLNQNHSYRDGQDPNAKQKLKMMYVGFSRPTHLLCFVALKENVKEHLDILCHTKGGLWEIDKELIYETLN